MIETLVVGAWFIAGIVGIYIHELTEEHEPADVLAAIFGPITLIRAIADAVESAEQRSAATQEPPNSRPESARQ